MGLVVRTNMPGINTGNALDKNTRKLGKSMQKLASGFKINTAADDASGLAVSEKMRNQITALDTVVDDCEDGVNLLQTAEGNISEIQEMVNRMVELAAKSTNGVLDDDDRDALQDEMNELCAEVDRISSTANFNGTKLLNGDVVQKDVDSVISIKYTGADFILPDNGAMTGLSSDATVRKILDYFKDNPSKFPADLKDNVGKITDKYEYSECFINDEYQNSNKGNDVPIDPADKCPTLGDYKLYFHKSGTPILIQNKDAAEPSGYNSTDWVSASIRKNHYTEKEVVKETFTDLDKLELKIGETSTKADDLRFKRPDLHSDKIFKAITTKEVTKTYSGSSSSVGGSFGGGVNHYGGGGGGTYTTTVKVADNFITNPKSTYKKGIAYDIRTQDSASRVLEHAQGVTEKISQERGNIGSLQNRLEYTINTTVTANENITAAKSRIKDTDMAKEMMNYTSQNVMSQASQSMLAQANSRAQDILSLLQQ